MAKRTTAAVALSAVLVLGACAPTDSSDPDPHPSASAVAEGLTLAFTGGFADLQVSEFQRLVQELTQGALRLVASGEFSTDDHGVEQAIIRAVADGRLDVGVVGARAFSELGVHDLDALVAPFAIDSVATQRAVLQSDVPDRMLAGLDEVGVVGLAVVGGPLRRPIAAERPLVSLADFAGIPFYSWHGDVMAAAVEALGAVNVDLAPPDRNAGIEDGSIRAYENALPYLAETADRRANIMTANVNLWPAVAVIIANPDTLDRIGASGTGLEAAAEQVAESALDLFGDDREVARRACEAGAGFAVATTADLAELYAAVASVIDEMAQDAATAGYLAEIATLRGDRPPDVVEVPTECLAG